MNRRRDAAVILVALSLATLATALPAGPQPAGRSTGSAFSWRTSSFLTSPFSTAGNVYAVAQFLALFSCRKSYSPPLKASSNTVWSR